MQLFKQEHKKYLNIFQIQMEDYSKSFKFERPNPIAAQNYFNLIFPLKLSELLIRAYQYAYHHQENYSDEKLALSEGEALALARFLSQITPKNLTLQIPKMEEFSKRVTEGLNFIFKEIIHACKNCDETEHLINHFIKLIRQFIFEKSIISDDTLKTFFENFIIKFVSGYNGKNIKEKEIESGIRLNHYLPTLNKPAFVGTKSLLFTEKPQSLNQATDAKDNNKVYLSISQEDADILKKFLRSEKEKTTKSSKCLIQ